MRFVLCAGAVLGTAFTGSVSAALLQSESFAYPVSSSLSGRNGGTGWGAAWQDGDNDVTTGASDTSLSYPTGVTLSSAGGRVSLSSEDSAAGATRALGAGVNLGANNSFWYASSLFRRSSITAGETAVEFVRSSDNIVRWSYGINALGQFYASVDPGNAAQIVTTTALAQPDTTYLVVAKIRTNTGAGSPPNDEVFLNFYGPGDTVGAEPGDTGWALRTQGNSGVILDQLRLRFSNAAGTTNEFDELRVGTAWADVTGVPEPTALAGVAVGGLLLLRRQRRSAVKA